MFVFVETPQCEFRETRFTRRFGSLFSSSPPSPRRCVGASRSSSIYFRARATRVVSLCDIDCLASSRIVRLASWLSPSKCARVSTRVGGSGFDVSLRSRESARVLGPRAAVLARVFQHLELAVVRRERARPLVPRASVLARPPQHVEVAAFSPGKKKRQNNVWAHPGRRRAYLPSRFEFLDAEGCVGCGIDGSTSLCRKMGKEVKGSKKILVPARIRTADTRFKVLGAKPLHYRNRCSRD